MIQKVVKEEIETLYNDGLKILGSFSKESIIDYEVWYTKSIRIISNIIPERTNEFIQYYEKDSSYIKQYFEYVPNQYIDDYTFSKPFILAKAKSNFQMQLGIIKSCIDMVDYTLKNIKELIEYDLMDSELEQAKELLKKKYYRASGAMCGVLMEYHLQGLLNKYNISPSKKNMSICDYNDQLKEVAYDNAVWRQIQWISDIRNNCDHNREDEPTEDDIKHLISSVEYVIKNTK